MCEKMSKKVKRIFLSLLCFLISILSSCVNTEEKKKEVLILEKNALLLDVRTPEEFAVGHLKGAINVPHTRIVPLLKKLSPDKKTPLYLYCRSGRRVKESISLLKKENYPFLTDLGGMKDAANSLALPVVK